MQAEQLQPNRLVRGSILPEPAKIIAAVPIGDSVKLICEGMLSGKVHQPILTPEQLDELEISPEQRPYDGDARKFRLGIEARRLGLAYEYDPYFSLSIARIDPLPHQLEAVYDYFLKLPRIRFLLADDPGAGKTIMAGLLLKELKIRGLVRRVLIVTPANLCFQWQREMLDKFRETFQVVRGEVLRANYGTNPWQDVHQCITSVAWVSRIEDARESLLRSHWDLVIVDEAHKMSAYSEDKKTLAYQLGEALSKRTDHYLLMTATPHKGDPQNFSLFLQLLDADVYGDVQSLEKAIHDRSAPFYLRRVKEALVTFPDPQTGQAKNLFTQRLVRTVPFQIDDEELDFYDDLTRYVEEQSIKASLDQSARGRALGFTMAMLQRRFASSIYAVRRSLERMKERRQKILEDPEAYRREKMLAKVPDDFDELPEEDQQEILEELETVVASINPADLREEIAVLGRLIDQARALEQREVESKLNRLRGVLNEEGILRHRDNKLLVFTEHKDTLDYLVEKMREWGLDVTQIHGGMKIGDRDTPGSRIYAEREFRDDCQVLVATEAAGEGINLQFCWMMINYDIPWNPNRLEQRMGRIHRYGQEKDCVIFNFVSTNTREGRVLEKLFERIRVIERDLDPGRTGKIFNVIGDIFPANQLERMLRDLYTRNLTLDVIQDRIVEQVDTERFRRITESALEGLARRELNLTALVSKSEEAKERRLVPEVIEDFFLQASPLGGLSPKQEAGHPHSYRLGRVSRSLLPYGDSLERRFGRLGRDYPRIVFDKALLAEDPKRDWVTPGHPLFESLRALVEDHTRDHLQRGAVFFDLSRQHPARLDVFSAEVRDGRGRTLHQRLFVTEAGADGTIQVRQPTIFLDLAAAPEGTSAPQTQGIASQDELETALYGQALQPLLEEERARREKEISTIARHVEIGLNAIIDRAQVQYAQLEALKASGSQEAGLEGRLRLAGDRLEEPNERLEQRRAQLGQEQRCTISNLQHLGSAWVMPHPERNNPSIRSMAPDPEIEQIAVQVVIAYEEARGWQVESVEAENRGFDLISRKPHPEDARTSVGVRFIEVKGRAQIGDVALTTNEFKTAQRLAPDYWLYAVFQCASRPELHLVQDPARLGWKPVVQIEHYEVGAGEILEAERRGG